MSVKKCKKCNKDFLSIQIINGLKRDLSKRINCLDCVPFGTNLSIANRTYEAKENIRLCTYCEKTQITKTAQYCSVKCHYMNINGLYIERWKRGEESGVCGIGQTSTRIRSYIFDKYKNRCAECGWNCVNIYTGKIPLEVEHIDGDFSNNKEENLTLLCPSCHSLTKTYKGANRGNGRPGRKTNELKNKRSIKTTDLNCAYCEKIFTKKTSEYKGKIKSGQKNFYCSCECSYKAQHNKYNINGN